MIDRPTLHLRRFYSALLLTTFFGATSLFGAAPPPEPAAPRIQVMVELDATPAAEVYGRELERLRPWLERVAAEAAARRAARTQLAAVEAAQRRTVAALTGGAIGARELYRLGRVLAAVAVAVEPGKVAAIRRLPGVRSVRRVVPKRPANSTSVPFLGVPEEVWDAMAFGATGEGISIGVVDTGVDYLHADFGGSGLAADYAANDPTTTGDGFFPTVVVAGGWDFAGDGYDAASDDPAAFTPNPDPDPMDCNGHGTHVAGTAAGRGVDGSGATYTGGYGPTTPFDELAVGPGVAPAATIYALKVFGCSGETALVEQALEWAVDPDGDGDFSDHLDVVNLSLTAPVGGAGDPTAVAADNAALAGVIVVASAGNDGDTHFVAGSPGSASRAISVAATWDPDDVFPARGVRITDPATIAATHQAGGANFGPGLVEPGVSGEAVLADPADACTPLGNPPAEIDGRIAVVLRSPECTFVTQVRHAQEAGSSGAIGVVIVNERPGLEGVRDDGTGSDVTIPPLLVRREAGQKILDELPGIVELTLTPIVLEDVFALFSSRGPRLGAGELAVKPDVAAPGVAITSARLGDATAGGTGGSILSGTSMATPHVAGTAALLRQLHPGWTVAEVKAALVGTAGDVTFDPEWTPPVVGPARMGAGRLRPGAAAETAVLAFDAAAPERVGVSFGRLEVVSAATVERSVRLANLGGSAATFRAAVQALSDLPGVAVTLPAGSEVTVPAGGTAELPLRLTADPPAMRHGHDPVLEEATYGFPRHWLSEEAGVVELTPTAGAAVPLRVPFYAAARPASSMAAAESPLDLGKVLVGETVLPLAGAGVDTGPDLPHDVLSLVSAVELQAVAGDGAPPGVAAVGVASDFAARSGGVAETEIFFGVAAAEEWSTPHEVVVEVAIDADRDGTADYLLESSDLGRLAFGLPTDAFHAVLVDLATGVETVQLPLGGALPEERDTAPFLTGVTLLGVAAADLGLTDGASAFDYTVTVAERGAGGNIAATAGPLEEPLTYDPANAGLSFTGGRVGPPTWPDLDGATVPVAFDLPAFEAAGSLGILLLHHHNRSGERVEVVPLHSTATIFADGFESGDTTEWSATVP